MEMNHSMLGGKPSGICKEKAPLPNGLRGFAKNIQLAEREGFEPSIR